MTYSELEKLLKKSGCKFLQEGKSHALWYSPKTGKAFTIGRHKTQEVATGTLKSIKKAAGID